MQKLEKSKIKGVLLDSGYVLIYPTQKDSWFIPPKMLDLINVDDNEKLNKLKECIQKAHSVLDKKEYNFIKTEAEEIKCFEDFYSVVLKNYDQNLNIEELSYEIAVDMATNPLKYAFYDDSKTIIPGLKEKFKIALVSDAWPSMRIIYDYNDMTKYFDEIVISSEIGVLKPHPDMYKNAMESLKLDPSECVFLDDNIDNCIGAKKLGIVPILVVRNHEEYLKKSKEYKDYIVIGNLSQLKSLLNN